MTKGQKDKKTKCLKVEMSKGEKSGFAIVLR